MRIQEEGERDTGHMHSVKRASKSDTAKQGVTDWKGFLLTNKGAKLAKIDNEARGCRMSRTGFGKDGFSVWFWLSNMQYSH